ncbi:MAG: MOSC N-terminal beta barrel domain-containing protein [Actinomycetota bacterium]|nr:MOSC N-terminal beta barrel domain-containing protein [Actinomycetota bacterium]
MKVAGLWRYPVKSMRGEGQASLELNQRGVEGDRRFGVLDLRSGTIVSAKRDARMLQAKALLAGVTLTIRLPTGETALGTGPTVDMALSAWLGRPVRLLEAEPAGRGTFEMPSDYEDDDSELVRHDCPAGSFVDVGPVHILTTSSIRAMTAERPDLQWNVARFRPNVLVDVDGDTPVEQDWLAGRLTVGEAELEVDRPCDRCVMTTRAQPGGIERQLDILRHINANHHCNLGVLARVTRPGRVEIGQAVSLDG